MYATTMGGDAIIEHLKSKDYHFTIKIKSKSPSLQTGCCTVQHKNLCNSKDRSVFPAPQYRRLLKRE